MDPRTSLALVSVFAGMLLLFEGLSPTLSNLFDAGLVFLGLALVTNYFATLGETFEEWMSDSPLRAFTPILCAVGVAIVWQSTHQIYALTSRMVMAALGFILILLPLLLLWWRGR